MAGIVSFGSYVPTYRLPRDVIAKEWGTPSLGGERAIRGKQNAAPSHSYQTGLTSGHPLCSLPNTGRCNFGTGTVVDNGRTAHILAGCIFGSWVVC